VEETEQPVKLLAIFADVVIEHFRSRMVYLYLALTVLAVGPLIGSDSGTRDITKTGDWFPVLAQASASQIEQRWEKLAQNSEAPAPVLEFAWPPAEPLPLPVEKRLVQLDLGGGIPLYIMEMPEAETAGILLLALGGTCDEQESEWGAADLAAALMNAAVKEHPDEFPLLSNPVHAALQQWEMSVECLPERFAMAVESLAKLALQPPVDPAAFPDTVSRQQQALDKQTSDPESRALAAVRANLMPGLRITADSQLIRHNIGRLDQSELRTWLERFLAPGRLTVVAAGPFDAEAAAAVLRRYLGPLASRPWNPPPQWPPAAAAAAAAVNVESSLFDDAAAAGAVAITPSAGNKIDPRIRQLVDLLDVDVQLPLRDEGLIYGGYLYGPYRVGQGFAWEYSFTSETRKIQLIRAELQRWTKRFPADWPDSIISALPLRAERKARAAGTQPGGTCRYIADNYLQWNELPISPDAAADQWAACSMADIRVILTAGGAQRVTATAVAKPKEGRK